MEEQFKKIDIVEVAHMYNPKLARRVPKFIYRKAKKLLHIDEINQFVEDHYNDSVLDFTHAAVDFLGYSCKILNEEYLTETDQMSPIIAANHPYGGPEAIALTQIFYERHPDLKVMTQKYMLFLKPLKPCFVLNTEGAKILSGMKAGAPLLLFPAGHNARILSFKEIYDYRWFSTFIKLARRYDRPLQPIHVDGHNTMRMLRLSKWRKRFGIKTNVEGMYLVDEMFQVKGKTITFTIGKPIDGKVFTTDVDDQEWADRIRQYVFELGKDPKAVFDPTKPATLPLV